jgi:regulator of protease activity HflC (stomatin/prohibitin superfamily)
VAKSGLSVRLKKASLRDGAYKETLDPGLRFLVPFADSLRARVDMRETVLDIEPQAVITKDNVGVTVDAVVYYYVTDAKAVRYEVANFYVAISKLAQTNLRNLVGDMSLDETWLRRSASTLSEVNTGRHGALRPEAGKSSPP